MSPRASRRAVCWLALAMLANACNWKAFGDAVVAETAGAGGSAGGDGGSNGAFQAELECPGQDCVAWCNPKTWPSGIPDAATDVVLGDGDIVVVDCDAEARTITIAAGGELRASRRHSASLQIYGNLVVRGRMDWGTSDDRIPADVEARVLLTDIDNDEFVGQTVAEVVSPPGIVPQDTGIWVVEGGVLTAAGALKRSWSRLLDGASPTDLSVVVEDARGWVPGDRLVLTPTSATSSEDYVTGFDETAIAALSRNVVALTRPPERLHHGCSDCLRRGEVINLSRNVTLGAEATGGYGHIYVAQQGQLALDSVAIEHMGPAWPEPRCGGPDRRSAIYFDRQGREGYGSELRHVVVSDSQAGFVYVEATDGVVLEDVAGYHGLASGFWTGYREDGCGDACPPVEELAPHDVTLTEVLAAGVGARPRPENCLSIDHRLAGFMLGGHDGSSCRECIGVGVAFIGGGADVGVFSVLEQQHGTPSAFDFVDSVAHNSDAHGVFIWQNGNYRPPPFSGLEFWSLAGHGIRSAGRGNGLRFADVVVRDTAQASLQLMSHPAHPEPRYQGIELESIELAVPLGIMYEPHHLQHLAFVGERSPAVVHAPVDCTGADPTDPESPDCRRQLLLIEGAVFQAGGVPFRFGAGGNHHSVWQIRGFSHPDYPDLPVDFDLYSPDAPQAEGYELPEFEAWLVPR